MTKRHSTGVTMPDMYEVEYFDLPDKVDVDDIFDNGKILNDARINEILQKVKVQGYVRLSKAELSQHFHIDDPKYSITFIGNQPYAIYKGIKANKHLGKGAFGKVKLAQNIVTGEWVALKIQSPLPGSEAMVEREYNTLVMLDEAKGVLMLRAPKGKKLQYEILMALASGKPLDKIINENITFTERLTLASLILNKFCELQDKNILHCDIKSENILANLLEKKITPIDYGLSLMMDPKTKYTTSQTMPTAYSAPETRAYRMLYQLVCNNLGKIDEKNVLYNDKTDTYSIGLVLADIFGLTNEENTALCKKEDAAFIQNKRISSTYMKEQIYSFLQKMTACDMTHVPSPENIPDSTQELIYIFYNMQNSRINLHDATKYFNGIQKNNLVLPRLVNKIGIIDLDEYSKENPDRKKDILSSIHLLNKIEFISDKYHNPKTYIELKRTIKSRYPYLEVKFFNGNNKENMIKKLCRAEKNKNAIIDNEIYIIAGENFKTQCQKLKQSITENMNKAVTEQDFKKVRSFLMSKAIYFKEEIDEYLGLDEDSELINYRINETLYGLSQKNAGNYLTYENLAQHLNDFSERGMRGNIESDFDNICEILNKELIEVKISNNREPSLLAEKIQNTLLNIIAIYEDGNLSYSKINNELKQLRNFEKQFPNIKHPEYKNSLRFALFSPEKRYKDIAHSPHSKHKYSR